MTPEESHQAFSWALNSTFWLIGFWWASMLSVHLLRYFVFGMVGTSYSKAGDE